VNDAPVEALLCGGPNHFGPPWYFEGVSASLQHLFRLAAVMLLCVTGAELYACEILAPQECESFGYPTDSGGSAADDNCICCCAHIIVAQPLELKPSNDVVLLLETPDPAFPQNRTLTFYRPPRV
jgi:hypothetical protein